MATLLTHVRVALRSLARSKGFAAAATLTLALGIGLSTAVFTVANATLIRRLPVTEQDRLVLLAGETRDSSSSRIPVRLTDVRDLERQSRALGGIAFYAFRGAVPAPVQSDDRLYPVQIGLVSGNYFDVLGSRALLGRPLRPDDDVEGAAPVVVLSHRAWLQRFGGDSSVVGQSMTMLSTGQRHTIVGVMPPGLEYPRGTEAWVPLVAYGAAGGFLDALTNELNLLARLRPGASVSQAAAELTDFLERPDAPAWQQNARGVAQPLADVVLGDTKPAVLLVTLAALVLLFLTCVNVANLLLVRALGGVRQLVVRSALGASRGRLVLQLLTESGVLAVAGGLLGAALAAGTVRLFVALAPAGMPRIDEVAIDGTMLVAAVTITTAAMLLSGLGPALLSSRVRASEVLAAGGRHTGGRRGRVVADGLAVAQVALAALSLAAAGLVGRSLVRLQRVDLAFDPGQLLAVSLAMRPDQITDEQRQRAALDQVVAETRAVAGVRDVTPVFAVPFVGEGGGVDGRVALPGQSREQRAANPIVNMETVAPNYFSMLGVALLRGRAFTSEDRQSSTAVVIVSHSVAHYFWPDADAIGRQLRLGDDDYTVVGVVPDTRYRELRTPRPTLYFPVAQAGFIPSTLLVRTNGPSDAVIPAVRRAVATAAGVGVVSTATIETLLDAPRAQPRLTAVVLGFFALSAVALAAIGLFAVIATMVRQRLRELGIRMALGATSARVGGAVMARGVWLALAGAAIGLAGTLAAGRLLSALLFEVSPTDATTLLGVAGILLVVAAVASLVPARLGMRVDPVTALRSDT